MEGFGQNLRQRGFSGPDGAFDGDEAGLFKELGHKSEKNSEGNTKITHPDDDPWWASS
jgi:hypothetical protein